MSCESDVKINLKIDGPANNKVQVKMLCGECYYEVLETLHRTLVPATMLAYFGYLKDDEERQ